MGAEIAIAACDLAEVIGSAIALNLLFHIPLFYGVLITGLDVLLILLLQRWGFRMIEALVITLIGTIIVMFGVQLFLSRPEYGPALHSLLIPSAQIVLNPTMLYHRHRHAWRNGHAAQSLSALVNRAEPQIQAHSRRQARSSLHVQCGLGSGADRGAVRKRSHRRCCRGGVLPQRPLKVAAIEDAYKLLSPLVGTAGASTLFAVALLASGQNSSITGTLAGQVVMEGFIHIRLEPWLRRMITRSIAIIPTIVVVWFTGERGTEKLLLLSQVILSLQLSFAVVPLVLFTGSRKKMGEFVNGPWLQGLSWIVAALIAGLNAWFLVLMLR